ncbi:hypothetical protein G0U57_019310 [Chelydra serpentina]|uniref:Uncharacterized protein n=1 Tax=Chelydra serpentina TaxID=8475 RepID=A0A8T1S5C0_CHESE|nr:hypothetical protein G0U57_019310 [Chelydra serpentina]
MESLVSLAECLPHAETDPDKHEKMQGHSKRASEKMKAAKKALEARRSALNSQIGDLLVRRKELDDEETQKKRKLSQLAIEREHREQMHTWVQEKLAMAENHLEELMTLLKKARKEAKCSKLMTNITLVLLPLYTLLVSMEFFQEALKVTDTKELFLSASVVTISCQVSMYIAQKAVRELQKTISQYKVQVSDYRREACLCDKERREIQAKIEDIQAGQGGIKKTGGELIELSAALQEEEEELKNHLQFVSRLTGKVDTLIAGPLDGEYACMILEEIYQLMRSVVEKGSRESLGFPDSETIKNLVKKLKHVVQALREDTAEP